MWQGFQLRPIAQQLILGMVAALVLVFSMTTWLVQQRAEDSALRVAEANLENEARLMAGMLDSWFAAARAPPADRTNRG